MSETKSFWDQHATFEEAEARWDEEAERLGRTQPIKPLKLRHTLPGLKGESRRGIRFKGLKYFLEHDKKGLFRTILFRRPWFYTRSLIASYFRKTTYVRDGDFFLYGMTSFEEFKQLLADPGTLMIVGFSYCEKPMECPSGRFTDQCTRDPEHPVCRQCFIGKCIHALPKERTTLMLIPTVHYTVEKIDELIESNPGRKVVFVITACELTLEMFGDGGNMLHLTGIGVRLDGFVCNTMRAFELSEEGVKTGRTIVLEPTQRRMLDLFADWRKRA